MTERKGYKEPENEEPICRECVEKMELVDPDDLRELSALTYTCSSCKLKFKNTDD